MSNPSHAAPAGDRSEIVRFEPDDEKTFRAAWLSLWRARAWPEDVPTNERRISRLKALQDAASRAALSSGETPAEPTPETDRCREIALRLNDRELNEEKVSVNQVRHVLRAAQPSAPPATEPGTDAAVLAEAALYFETCGDMRFHGTQATAREMATAIRRAARASRAGGTV